SPSRPTWRTRRPSPPMLPWSSSAGVESSRHRRSSEPRPRSRLCPPEGSTRRTSQQEIDELHDRGRKSALAGANKHLPVCPIVAQVNQSHDIAAAYLLHFHLDVGMQSRPGGPPRRKLLAHGGRIGKQMHGRLLHGRSQTGSPPLPSTLGSSTCACR